MKREKGGEEKREVRTEHLIERMRRQRKKGRREEDNKGEDGRMELIKREGKI